MCVCVMCVRCVCSIELSFLFFVGRKGKGPGKGTKDKGGGSLLKLKAPKKKITKNYKK